MKEPVSVVVEPWSVGWGEQPEGRRDGSACRLRVRRRSATLGKAPVVGALAEVLVLRFQEERWEGGWSRRIVRVVQRHAPQEEVVRVGREAAVLEEPQQVVVLPVNVAHNLDGGLQLQQRRLVDEDLGGLLDEERHLIAAQVHLAPRLLCAPRGRSQSISTPRWHQRSCRARGGRARTLARGQQLGDQSIDLLGHGGLRTRCTGRGSQTGALNRLPRATRGAPDASSAQGDERAFKRLVVPLPAVSRSCPSHARVVRKRAPGTGARPAPLEPSGQTCRSRLREQADSTTGFRALYFLFSADSDP